MFYCALKSLLDCSSLHGELFTVLQTIHVRPKHFLTSHIIIPFKLVLAAQENSKQVNTLDLLANHFPNYSCIFLLTSFQISPIHPCTSSSALYICCDKNHPNINVSLTFPSCIMYLYCVSARFLTLCFKLGYLLFQVIDLLVI